MRVRSRILGRAGLPFLLICLAVSEFSCAGDSIEPPTTGTLHITIATSGSSPDIDGYGFIMDGGVSEPVEATSIKQLDDLTVGDHTLALSGIAGNCTVEGENPRTITVTAGGAVATAFSIVCVTPPPTSGTLTITTQTTGARLDPDGYSVRVDTEGAQAIGINATLTVPLVLPGVHSVLLEGLATNCKMVGDNPADVTVAAGATAHVAFTVSCQIPTVQRWTVMPSGTGKDLIAISGSSSTNVFVVGKNPSGSPTEATILHYDGVSWSVQLTQADLTLNDVWVASSTDAYAVGWERDPLGFPMLGTFLHYDGREWSKMPPPAFDPSRPELEVFPRAIWGNSATDVFAVGVEAPNAFEYNGYIAHYDGNAWTTQSAGQWVDMYDIWGSSGTFYATGLSHEPDEIEQDRGVVLQYDGHEWSGSPLETTALFTQMGGSSPADVYATGPESWHFDGKKWSPLALPAGLRLNSVWAPSSTDVFGLSTLADPGIVHFDGNQWKLLYADPTLHALWGSSGTNVFAVGDGGLILHGTPLTTSSRQ